MKYKYYFNYDDYGQNAYTNSSIKDSLSYLGNFSSTLTFRAAVSHMRNDKNKCFAKSLAKCDNNLHFDFAEFYIISGKSREELSCELLRQFKSFKDLNGLPDRIDFHQNMHKNFKLLRVINNSKDICSITLRPIVQFPMSDNWMFSLTKYMFTFIYQSLGKMLFSNLNFGNELIVTNIHKATKQKIKILMVFNKIFGYDLLIPMHPHIYIEKEYMFINLLNENNEI